MKLNKLKGVLATLLSGLLFLAAGSLVFASTYPFQTPQEMYEAGSAYSEMNLKPDQSVVIKLVDISEPISNEDGVIIYFVAFEESDFAIGLEVKEKSKSQDTISQWLSSPDQPAYISGKLIKLDAETSNLISQINDSTPTQINTRYFLSALEYENESFWLPIVGGLLGLLGLGMIIYSILIWKNNTRNYNLLVQTYPELRFRAHLKDHADFIGKKSRISVYKNHLISQQSKLQIIDLSQIKWLNLEYVYVFRSGQHTYIHYLDTNHQSTKLNVGQYKRKHQAEHQALLAHLSSNFPHLLLGRENLPEETIKKN